MIYISNEIKIITLVRRGSFTPTDEVYKLYLKNNYSNFNSCVELYDISDNPKQFRFELSDEQFENLDFGEYNYVLMNGSDKVHTGLIRVIQGFEADIVYDWHHGDQPEPEPVYYEVYIAAGENGHLVIDGEMYTVYVDTLLKGTRLAVGAVADIGYDIDQWNDGSIAEVRDIIVNSDINMSVQFKEEVPVVYHRVELYADPHGSFIVNGEEYIEDYIDTIEDGTELVVEANPFQGYTFEQWSDGDTSNPRTITIQSDITLSAEFEAIPVVNYFQVNITAGENGTVSVNGVLGDFSQQVAENTVLTVLASGNTDYAFEQWSDGDTSNPRTIMVTDNVNLTSIYEYVGILYTVSISASSNGSVTVDGIAGNYYNSNITPGTQLVAVATPDQDYQFQGWSDGDLNQTRTITVTSNVTISAAFEAIPSTMYWVNINSGANGQVSVNGVVGNYSQQVPENTILSVEAIPATGFEFIQWSDGNTSAERNIIVTGDIQLQSSYQIMSYSVSIASDDANKGTVTVNGTTGDYSSTMTYGSLLTFSATPATGYVFLGWSDGDTNTSRITSVTSDISLIGTFGLPENYLVRYKTKTASPVMPTTTSGWGANYRRNDYDYATQEGQLVFDAPVTSFPTNAFINKTNLTYIEIPNNTTRIGNHAFEGCSNLEEIVVNPVNEPTVEAETFKNIKTGGQLLRYSTSLPREKVLVDINYTENWLNYDTYKLGSYGWNGLNGTSNYKNDECGTYYYLNYYRDSNDTYNDFNTSKLYSKGTTTKATYYGSFVLNTTLHKTQLRFSTNYLNVGDSLLRSGIIIGDSLLRSGNIISITLGRNVYKVNASFKNNIIIEDVELGCAIVGDQTFFGCTSLKSVVFHNVKEMGELVFDGNTNLTSITFYGKEPPRILNNTFGNMPETGTLYLPRNAGNAYDEIISYLPGWTVIYM